ncbi:hypothetical protein D3C84_803510 [compost metagenome]
MQTISQVQAKKHQTFGAGYPVAGVEHRQAQGGDAKHHRQVEIQGVGRDRQRLWRHQRSQAEHGQQVEQIAADDVAHGDLAFAAQGGNQRGGQFRQRGTDRDHGQADDPFRQAQVNRDLDCGLK